MKAVIVGGGIMGCSIALELAQAGLEVTVLERAIPGAEASTAAAGMLAPQLEAKAPGAMLELSMRSRALYPAWARQLESASGVEIGYLESGALQLAFTEHELHELDATVAWQQAASLRATLLSGDEVLALEPNVSGDVRGAAHFPDDHQVDPRRLMQALSTATAKAGVTFRTGYVRRVIDEAGAATGVDLDGEAVRADLTIVAAGSWSSLVPGAHLDPQHLKPARGQLLELKLRLPPTRHLLKAGSSYVVPRADGRVICGATVELVGYDKRVTAEGLATVLSQALRCCPALKAATFTEAWAGLRPSTADDLPLLGEGALKNLVIASGHHRNGILLAPITARLVTQLITGQRLSMSLSAFNPTRFGAVT